MKKARERTQEQGTQTPFPGPGLNAAQNQDHLSHELVIGTVNGATSQSLSDEDLLHRIKQYDQAAWSELYKRYFQDLLRFQRWGKDDAEDLAQEVMYRVCRCAHSFRGGSFSAWIFAIARNVRADYWRNHLGTPEEQMPEYPDEDGATKLMDAEDLSIRPAAVNFDADDLLISALDSLPRVERQAILLTDIKEFSITETAEVMRKSEATVKQYIARAYSRMREFLSRSLNRSTLEMRHEQATSESRTRECAIAAEKPTADAVAGEGQVLGDEAADLNSAPSPNSAVNDSAAVVPRSEQDRPMTSHQRYARLSTLLRTIQDRAALPHRVQRFSSEIGEQQEMIKGWMEELDAMVTKNQATGAIQST